jgi:hypothetical protein
VNILDQLDLLMQNQRRTIRWYQWFAAILLMSGVVVFLSILLFGNRLGPDPMKTVLSIGGGLVASVSVFPLKEVNGCRDRLALYQKLKAEVLSSNDVDRCKIESLIWDAVRKIALG